MLPELPKTKEEYLKILEMAFNEGQKSMEGVLKYERYGDREAYARTAPIFDFKYWAAYEWKYGKTNCI